MSSPCPSRYLHDLADNTNPDPDTRATWVNLAKKYKVPARCVWFKTPRKVCEHNDVVRALNESVSYRPLNAWGRMGY